MVTRIIEANEILIQPVSHKHIQPSIVIHIAASNRDRRLHVDTVTEGRFCDLFESFSVNIPEQTIHDRVRQHLVAHRRSVIEFIAYKPISRDVEVLVPIIVEVARRDCRAVRQCQIRA